MKKRGRRRKINEKRGGNFNCEREREDGRKKGRRGLGSCWEKEDEREVVMMVLHAGVVMVRKAERRLWLGGQ